MKSLFLTRTYSTLHRISSLILIFTLFATTFILPNPLISIDKVDAAPNAAPLNQRLAINVGINGRFNIGAFPDPITGSAIANVSWDLSYGWPYTPGTSFTTFRIDENDHIYGTNGTQVQAPADIDPKTNQSTWQYDDIEITQHLQIVPNIFTGEEDVAKITYTLTNTDSLPHIVGSRVMIDTRINYEDGAPFRIPGDINGIIKKERDFIGTAVPDYFQVFHHVYDNTHIASARLKPAGVMPPDRLEGV